MDYYSFERTKMMLEYKKNKNRGFTLIELVAVITLLMLLASLALPKYTDIVDKQRLKTDASTAVQLASIADAVAHCARYPSSMIMPFIEEREGEPHLCIPDDLGYPVTSEPMGGAMRG